ncbi:NAC domain containing protein 57 [Prunus dulcis]|uniref:NAC domain containing protein 57 n=1 Tax=Prunus dulcis TaxID=3755 RepID=A0A4Y1R0V6_PRUDU|nr:NAC domain containing protein 57 [Prunus dulcis]
MRPAATDGGVSVPMGLLPGFRFSPTEEELLSFYLKKKIAGEDSEFSDLIPEINVCEREPRDLPEYFFSKPNYMNTNSNRCSRTTDEGFYKSTGQVREVKAELSQAVIGNKRILPFLEGRAPDGKITKYAQLSPNPNQQREFVLNHLTTKSVNYKKRRYDSICDKLAEPGIASNYKDDQAAAAANMILEPQEHLADKDVLLGSEKHNEGAESESANGSCLIDNNDISTLDVGLPGGCFSSGSDNLAVNDSFHEVSFQPERNLMTSPFHPSSQRDIPLRSPVHTGLLGDVDTHTSISTSIHSCLHTPEALREESDCKAVSQDRVRDAAEYCFALHLQTKSWKHTTDS